MMSWRRAAVVGLMPRWWVLVTFTCKRESYRAGMRESTEKESRFRAEKR